MSDCTRCGSSLGFLHHGPLCDTCLAADDAARLRDAARAISDIRVSDGSDASAVQSLARLVADEAQVQGGSRSSGQSIEDLVLAAATEEVDAALAAADPSGAGDGRMTAVVSALTTAMPGNDAIARTIQPRLPELRLREISRGRLPAVTPTVISLEGGETALFEDAAQLLEPSPVRGTKGMFGSTRIRITDGVSVRVGGFNAESSPKRVEMHATDKGTLTVTTDRVIFIGSARDVEFKRSDVLTTVTAQQAFLVGPSITFHFRRRKNPVGFVLGADAIRMLEAILRFSPQPPSVAPAAPTGPASKAPSEKAKPPESEEWWKP